MAKKTISRSMGTRDVVLSSNKCNLQRTFVAKTCETSDRMIQKTRRNNKNQNLSQMKTMRKKHQTKTNQPKSSQTRVKSKGRNDSNKSSSKNPTRMTKKAVMTRKEKKAKTRTRTKMNQKKASQKDITDSLVLSILTPKVTIVIWKELCEIDIFKKSLKRSANTILVRKEENRASTSTVIKT